MNQGYLKLLGLLFSTTEYCFTNNISCLSDVLNVFFSRAWNPLFTRQSKRKSYIFVLL